MFFSIPPGSIVRFEYLNHRGETASRTVHFKLLQYGSNHWYPNDQWFLHGRDMDREEYRSFALDKIKAGTMQVIS